MTEILLGSNGNPGVNDQFSDGGDGGGGGAGDNNFGFSMLIVHVEEILMMSLLDK
jgi:hypothetical protein